MGYKFPRFEPVCFATIGNQGLIVIAPKAQGQANTLAMENKQLS